MEADLNSLGRSLGSFGGELESRRKGDGRDAGLGGLREGGSGGKGRVETGEFDLGGACVGEGGGMALPIGCADALDPAFPPRA